QAPQPLHREHRVGQRRRICQPFPNQAGGADVGGGNPPQAAIRPENSHVFARCRVRIAFVSGGERRDRLANGAIKSHLELSVGAEKKGKVEHRGIFPAAQNRWRGSQSTPWISSSLASHELTSPLRELHLPLRA